MSARPAPTDAPRYRERLWPRWWLWSIPLGLVGLLAAAYGSAYGAPVGWAILAGGSIVAAAGLAALSPSIEVDATGISAGHARLPWAAVASIDPLDPTVLAERRRSGDVRAFTMLRPWSGSAAVEITLDDGSDPHPLWLVTSRRPLRLAECARAWLAPDRGRTTDRAPDTAE